MGDHRKADCRISRPASPHGAEYVHGKIPLAGKQKEQREAAVRERDALHGAEHTESWLARLSGACAVLYPAPMLRLAIVVCLALTTAPLAAAAGNSFTSPTKRISCAVFEDSLRCDVLGYAWKNLPPKPGSCDFDWGGAVGLSASGRPRHLCVSDAVDRGRVLGYDKSWRYGSFRCTMRTSGVTCTNRSQHGFELARERFRFF